MIRPLYLGTNHNIYQPLCAVARSVGGHAPSVRTLVYDPEVLVLDEATSSVDTETEELVQRAVEVLMEGRTSLVVAHRLSTVQHASQILVLHRGEVRERGSHQQLLARPEGLYRRLYELQFAGQERAAA